MLEQTIIGYDKKLDTSLSGYQLLECLKNRSISKNNKIDVSFSCVKCNNIITISYNRFQHKYLKDELICSLCKDGISLEVQIKESEKEWLKMNRNLKKYYFVSQLLEEEFNDLKLRIQKIDRETNIKDLVFIPYFWNINQKHFTPLLHNKIKNISWIPKKVELRCDCCHTFFSQNWTYLKNKRFLFCPVCVQEANSRKI